MKKYTISLTNFKLNRLRGLNLWRVLLEKYTISSLTKLSTRQTQRPQGACPARNCIHLLLNKLPIKQTQRPQGRRPKCRAGACSVRKVCPLLLIKPTYLHVHIHIQIRHVHLYFRKNIVLLMSYANSYSSCQIDLQNGNRSQCATATQLAPKSHTKTKSLLCLIKMLKMWIKILSQQQTQKTPTNNAHKAPACRFYETHNSKTPTCLSCKNIFTAPGLTPQRQHLHVWI